MLKYNIGLEFHLYGFHRDRGGYPGILLRSKLEKLIADQKPDVVELDLGDMKALYGSFVDGAFGLFIDRHREKFFEKFVFVSEKRPEYLKVINEIYNRHKVIDFNAQ